jgi:hypothetical protein
MYTNKISDYNIVMSAKTNIEIEEDIYSELKRVSGPYTDLSQVSLKLTGHDLYASYHFATFEKRNALRNTLVRFDEFGISNNLCGKKMFDIGCCLGALAFESARRECDFVTGFEYCEDRVNVCNRLVEYIGLKNAKFVVADVDIATKNPDEFIDAYGKADYVFCCALDAYVNKDRLYKFVSLITHNTCFFETNSGIATKEFTDIMKNNGFSQITHLGMSKSDPGYGRQSYILKK